MKCLKSRLWPSTFSWRWWCDCRSLWWRRVEADHSQAWCEAFTHRSMKNSPTVLVGPKSIGIFALYFLLLSKYCIFLFSVFVTVYGYLWACIASFVHGIATRPLNSKPLEFLWYITPFLKYKWFDFRQYALQWIKICWPKKSFCTQIILKKYLFKLLHNYKTQLF